MRLEDQHRTTLQISSDSVAWVLGITAATFFRFDLHLGQVDWAGLIALIPLAVLTQAVCGLGLGLYLGRSRYGSLDEVSSLASATAATTAVIFLVDSSVSTPHMIPLGAALGGGGIAAVAMGGVRYAWRLVVERVNMGAREGDIRIIVFGAGEAGTQAIRAIIGDSNAGMFPVGLLDDDPSKRNLRICGVPMLGDRYQVEQAARRVDAEALLIATPGAPREVIAELDAMGRDAGLQVKVLPPIGQLFGGLVGVGDIRDISEADLLGRREIDTDISSIAEHLRGRRVLVTGAGGSIGSELCKQISLFDPFELILLDHDESALQGVQLALEGRSMMDSPSLVPVDIRDANTLQEVLSEKRPDVVFHAAALKHLPILEYYPAEAIKTNIFGTINVLEASIAAGVGRIINISTDKAADPTSVLGYTKRIGERLVAGYSVRDDVTATCLSVRFGNVLGSRGSVLTIFDEQARMGGPITVTHPDITRFFMTVSEAVQLVVQATSIGSTGETLVLDMGEPVRISDVAQRIASRSSTPIEIVYTGLRANEKLHEVMFGAGEIDCRPMHPMISHVRVPPMDPSDVLQLDTSGSIECIVDMLRSVCGRTCS